MDFQTVQKHPYAGTAQHHGSKFGQQSHPELVVIDHYLNTKQRRCVNLDGKLTRYCSHVFGILSTTTKRFLDPTGVHKKNS